MNGTNNFIDKEEAINCSKEGKYSILSELNSSLKRHNKYEFLLEYPELGTYNTWLQTNRPIDETEHGDKYVEGFKPLITLAPCGGWGGLCLTNSSDPYSLLNGTPGGIGNGNYYIAVGVYTKSTWNHGLIPANSGTPVNIVKLWVRAPIAYERLTYNINRRDYFLSLIFCCLIIK